MKQQHNHPQMAHARYQQSDVFVQVKVKKFKFDPVEGFFVVVSYNFDPVINSEVVFMFSKMTYETILALSIRRMTT